MAPSFNAHARSSLERVRHQFLTALHLGKLLPGDRVPSVRRLADMTGLNRKTVHRAYQLLANEGLLDLRPGSGTFIAAVGESPTPIAELLLAANRSRVTAGSLGLAPEVFASFLQLYHSSRLSGLPLLVAECNQEQLGLIEHELRATLGIAARSVLLPELASRTAHWVQGSWGVVTTDCHLKEVGALLGPFAVPVYRIALDPTFPQQLLEHARRMPVVMVVRDANFVPAFSRLLKQLSVPGELLQRFSIVERQEAAALLREIKEPAAVYISPLVPFEFSLPSRFQRLRLQWRIEAGSLERLKASLALELAQRGAAAGPHPLQPRARAALPRRSDAQVNL